MTGFNLPPGCEVHHIPGNRPEDVAEEMFWEAVDNECAKQGIEHPVGWEDTYTFLDVIRNLAYAAGYNDGYSEAKDVEFCEGGNDG